MNRTVFYISDGTAITAETLGHTLLTQFDNLRYRQVTLPFVDNLDKARAAVESIDRAAVEDGARPIVFSTLIHAGVQECVSSANALVLDLFSVFIKPLEMELGLASIHATGRSHGLVDSASYDFRIDAVNFALQHDDGASSKHYDDADVILVGVSRSGKTPTSLYLAMQFGVHVANYPLTSEDLDSGQLPKLLRSYRGRLFGLTIDPERLQQIRSERRPNSRYASLNQCRLEVAEVEHLFRRAGVPYINTTTVSIEEIASRILQEMGLSRRLFSGLGSA